MPKADTAWPRTRWSLWQAARRNITTASWRLKENPPTLIPCPSCGMTTSFAHAADGNILGALQAQPAGAVLAFLTACTLVIATWQLVTGERLLGFCTDRIGARFFMCFGALVLLAWIYKILVFRGVF